MRNSSDPPMVFCGLLERTPTTTTTCVAEGEVVYRLPLQGIEGLRDATALSFLPLPSSQTRKREMQIHA